jgi:hypothetical protein
VFGPHYWVEGVVSMGKIRSSEKLVLAADARSSPIRAQRPVAIIIALSCVLSSCHKYQSKMDDIIQPHIKAPAYVWPAGCEKKKYSYDNSISMACKNVNYLFNEFKLAHYNLPYFGRGNDYYRVDDDLILMQCNFQNSCSVSFVVKNSFYQ